MTQSLTSWCRMANRNMQQKAMKMRRQKRAWAKSLQRRGLMQPNRDVIKEYKAHARGLEDKDFVDSVANEILPFKNKEKLRRQAELEAGLPDNCDHRIIGPTGRDALQESWIYFNSQKNCFVLVHVDLEESIERKSQTYSSLEMLMMVWEGGAIRWREKRVIAR